MKKEVILVPKDKYPLDVLLEMGEQTLKISWIILHKNAYQKLFKTSNFRSETNTMNAAQMGYMKWKDTEERSETILFCDVPDLTWGKIRSLEVTGVALSICPSDPEDIYFLKMDE